MGLYTIQSKNFRLLRTSYGSHENLAQRLKGTVNGTQLSRFTTAEEVANPSIIARIESALSLPIGWFDRDNLAFTELSAADHELFSRIRDTPYSARAALLHFLKELQPKNEVVVITQKDQ